MGLSGVSVNIRVNEELLDDISQLEI